MGKPINLNVNGLRASNEKKRQEAEAAVIKALRMAGKRGLTAMDIVLTTGVSYHTVRKCMPNLRVDGLAHVGPWELHGTLLVPSYIYGPGIDAKREDYLHLFADVVAVDAEHEARKEVERKHAKWARDWKPHRAAEAAWF